MSPPPDGHRPRRWPRTLAGIAPPRTEGRFQRLELLGIANGGLFLAAIVLLILFLGKTPSPWLLAILGILLVCGVDALILRHHFWTVIEQELQRRKRAEQEARAADRAKGEFLANVSHEMRTPMHGVLGMADLLLQAELAPAQREQVEMIRTSSEALLALVDDILDLSRIEAGRLTLRRRDFALRKLTREVERLLGPQVRDRGIELAVRVAPALPDRLHGDPGRLRQVLLNLVGNAVRFTRRGSVTVAFDLARREGAGETLRCEVRDTGVGIRPEVQARLFQPYSRSDGSDSIASREPQGTGLGLVISKSIVELMGGAIGFESTRGVGSTFWFELPVVLARAAPAAGAPDTAADAARRARHGRRILVVDDHPVNRRVALAQLASLGFEASAAEDGEAALAAIAGVAGEPPFDAVLLDCSMPGFDGYETCRRLRAREAGGRRTVVIAVTAHAGPGERERSLAAGMDDFLTKPARGEELAAVLDRWLAGAAAGEPAARRLEESLEGSLEESPEERLAALDRLGETTGEAMRRQVVEEFLRQGSRDLETMQSALDRGDGAALAAAAHSLAGSSAILGAAELAAGCAGLEALAGQQGPAACASPLEAVRQGYGALAARLTA